MRRLPLTVLGWEGPQARAYLVGMRRAGLVPERILLMVRDRGPIPWSRASTPGLRLAERLQDRSHNFHPKRILARDPSFVRTIADALAGHVADPAAWYREMFDEWSWDRCDAPVRRVAASGYRDPAVLDALRDVGPGTVLFTGGGIVPRSVFELEGVELVHVHTGFLPHVRGADVLLWSLLARGRPGVSAFLMSPGLDDGDVLAAEELPELAIPLGADRPDDDTLYRAVFSFVDPLLRADLLVRRVLEPAVDVAALRGTPQDLDTGVTFHFMHPAIRHVALTRLFPTTAGAPIGTAGTHGTQIGAPGSPSRYAPSYEKPSATAPLRMAADAARVGSGLRAVSIRNRQTDYGRVSRDPALFALHRRLNAHLVAQERDWPSYDYGEGYYYQSSDELRITGLRDTTGRVGAFGLAELVTGRRVLEIGCNTGFLSLAIAPAAAQVDAFELNPHLISIARDAATHLRITNVAFSVSSFEDLETDGAYDDVLSFANHHTYDGNTHQDLETYFARCHALTRPGGRLIFESHPPELEGDGFPDTLALIERWFTVERHEIHEYGTFLDRGRHFVVGTRREAT